MFRRALASTLLTAAALASFAACSSDAAQAPRLYASTPPPAVPDRTSPIDPSWVEGSGETLGTGVANGTYWAEAIGAGTSDRPYVDFDLAQAFFGDACVRELGAAACAGDFAVVSDPHGALPAFVDDLGAVSVVGADRRNYAIDGEELYSLATGNPPAQAAPEGFEFTSYPFVVVVRSGRIVEARQIWTG